MNFIKIGDTLINLNNVTRIDDEIGQVVFYFNHSEDKEFMGCQTKAETSYYAWVDGLDSAYPQAKAAYQFLCKGALTYPYDTDAQDMDTDKDEPKLTVTEYYWLNRVAKNPIGSEGNQEILQTLVDLGFVHKSNVTRMYYIAADGRRFLESLTSSQSDDEAQPEADDSDEYLIDERIPDDPTVRRFKVNAKIGAVKYEADLKPHKHLHSDDSVLAEGVDSDDDVVFIGKVDTLRNLQTKDNETMAVIEVYDAYNDKIETCVLLPRTWLTYRDVIQGGTWLIVTGKEQLVDGKKQIAVVSIELAAYRMSKYGNVIRISDNTVIGSFHNVAMAEKLNSIVVNLLNDETAMLRHQLAEAQARIGKLEAEKDALFDSVRTVGKATLDFVKYLEKTAGGISAMDRSQIARLREIIKERID